MRPSLRATAASVWIPLCFILAGLAGTMYNLRDIYDSYASASWPQTEGTVLEAAVVRRQRRPNKTLYEPDVTFSYHAEGQMLTGTSLVFGGPLSFYDYEEANAIVGRFAEGTAAVVYHHPTNPRRATLMPGHYGADLGPRMMFSVSLMVVGVLLVFRYFLWGSAADQQERQRSLRAGPRHRRATTRRRRLS